MALNRALLIKRSIESIVSYYYWIFLLRKIVEQCFFRLLRSSIRVINKLKKILIQQLNNIKKSLIKFIKKPKKRKKLKKLRNKKLLG